jgi:iron complex transport system ATP-binding protein
MLEVCNLTVAYGARMVLQNISLRVQSGEILALIGPNGAGKTTLIKTLSGVLKPHRGSILLDGQDALRLTIRQFARLVATVPQARHLPDSVSVYDTVLLGRTPHLGWLGQVSERDRQRVQEALQKTGALDLSERTLGRLSGGEQQRVLLARALAQDTPILLLDEPTTHLDLHHQTVLLQLVRELAREHGLAVVMALHDLNLASLYADRVALLVRGELRGLGTPADVLTAERLSQAYALPLHVITHPDYGAPLILPDGPA